MFGSRALSYSAMLTAVGLILTDPSSQALSETRYRSVARDWQRSVCFIEAFGPQSTLGTGFLSKTWDPKTCLLFTARHMLENMDSIRVTARAFDSVGNDAPLIGVFTLNENGNRIYRISDTTQDCSWIAIETLTLVRSAPAGFRVFAMEPRNYVETSSLLPGVPVVICGYPLGRSVVGRTPLIRKGSIAAVDDSSNQILLDVSTVGGFSGGPVIIDKTELLGQEIEGTFVGLHFAKTRYTASKEIARVSDTITLTEEVQYARVVPASVLKRSVDLFGSKPSQ